MRRSLKVAFHHSGKTPPFAKSVQMGHRKGAVAQVAKLGWFVDEGNCMRSGGGILFALQEFA